MGRVHACIRLDVVLLSVGNKKNYRNLSTFLWEIVIMAWKQKDYQHVYVIIDSSHGSLLN